MTEFKADIDILVECVKCQQNNPDSLRQSLMTLSTLVSSDEAKDYFRESGGLKYVYNLLLRTETTDIRVATLFCLASAVEKNVFSQKMLTHQSVFFTIHEILQRPDSSCKLRQASVFFLLCLVANNSQAQNQVRETGCLADLMDTFRLLLSKDQASITEEIGPFGLVTSALSMCVNNPQNEENQRLCSTLLPHIFSLVSRVSSVQIVSPVLSLTGLMVACNVFNQDRVRKCGGLDVLISYLHRLTATGQEEEDFLTAAVQVVATIDSCLTDNESNTNKFREVCGTGPLFTLLTPGKLSQQEQLQVVIAVSHVINTNSRGMYLLSSEDFQKLVCLLTQSDDEELVKALKYVLHMCKNPDEDDKMTKNKSASTEASNLKQSSHLILRRIDELAAKLDTYQEESRQDSFNVHDQNNSCSMPKTNALIDSLVDPQVTNHQVQTSRRMSDLVSERMKTFFVENPAVPSEAPVHYQHESDTDVQEASSYLVNWLKQLIPQFIRTGQVDLESSHERTPYPTDRRLPSQFEQAPIAFDHHFGQDNPPLATGQQRMNCSMTSPFNQRAPILEKTSCCRPSVLDRLNGHAGERYQDTGSHCKPGGDARAGTLYDTREHSAQLNCPIHQDFHRQGVPPYGNYFSGQEIGGTAPSDDNHCLSVFDYQHGHVGEGMDNQKCECAECCQPQNHSQIQYCRNCVRTEDNNMMRDDNRDHGVCSNVIQRNYHHQSESSCSNPQYGSYCLPDGNTVGGHRQEPHYTSWSVHDINCNTNNSNVVCSRTSSAGTSQHLRNKSSKVKENRTLCADCGKEPVENMSSPQGDPTSELLSNGDSEVFIENGHNQKIQQDHVNPGDTTGVDKHFSGCDEKCNSSAEKEAMVHRDDLLSLKQTTSLACSKSLKGRLETTHLEQEPLRSSRKSVSNEYKRNGDTQRSLIRSRSLCDLYTPERESSLKSVEATKIPSTVVRRNSVSSGSIRSSLRRGRQIMTPDSSKSTSSSVFKTPAPPVVASQFLRPTNVPLRRKVKTPSTCGSTSSSIGSKHNVRVLARKSVVGIQPNPVMENDVQRRSPTCDFLTSPRVTPLPSPAHSEFDLSLLKTARSTKSNKSQKYYGSFTPTVKTLTSSNVKCWTDVRPTVCPAPRYSKAVSMVNWSEFSDDDSESVYSATDDSSYTSEESGEDAEMTATEDDIMNISTSQLDLCPGCHPPCASIRPLLNSRTYNIALETITGTCHKHRKMRCLEREFILRQKANTGVPVKTRPLPELGKRNPVNSCPPLKGLSVYDFNTSSCDSELSKKIVSPPLTTVCSSNIPVCAGVRRQRKKRKRIEYTEEEVMNLYDGVEKLGTKWNQILVTYKFHPSRSAVDLKEKHMRLVKDSQEAKKKKKKWRRPFSMCEERRLRRGVKTLGYNWKGILQMFHFARGRRAEELRNKWRTMMRKGEH